MDDSLYSAVCGRDRNSMRDGGDTLMAVSPAWVLPVVIIIGIIASVIISNLTAKLFKLK